MVDKLREDVRDLIANNYSLSPVPDIYVQENRDRKASTPEEKEVYIVEESVRNIDRADITYSSVDITVTVIIEILDQSGNARNIKNEVSRILMNNRTKVSDFGFDKIEPPENEIKDPSIREGQATISVDFVRKNANPVEFFD